MAPTLRALTTLLVAAAPCVVVGWGAPATPRALRRTPIRASAATPDEIRFGPPPPPPSKVTVKFVNTPLGKDVVTSAMTGEILLHVADKVGITIPRGCKSGVCGACTTDLVDPNWDAFSAAAVQTERTDQTDVGVVEGMQIVRACSTKVTLLPGQDEMVIDLRRMSDPESGAPQDPMARFSGDWENEFVPDYKKNLGKGEDAEDEGPSFGSAGVAPWDMVW